MPARFTATFNAFEKGIESVKPNAAVKLIEGWEAELDKTDVPGAKGIARDLESLRKALDKDEPDGERVSALVGKLAKAVTKIAPKADDKVAPKLEQLGQALQDAGTDSDEDEDEVEDAPKPAKAK